MTPLLLECCRVHPDPDELRRLAAQCSDWEGFCKSATFHKTAPLAFWSLRNTCADVAPSHILASLGNAFRAETRRNLLFASELVRVLNLLRQAGILAVPYKGPAVAWSLYEAPGLRPMSDLDVLVPEDCAEKAIETLLSSGYRRRYSIKADLRFCKHHGEMDLISPNGGTPIDLHWRLAQDYLLDASRFLSVLHTAAIDAEPVPAFPPEALLEFLCVHAGKHGWPFLIWICDVARLMPQVDWALILAQMERSRSSRSVLLGIQLAMDLLGADAPVEVKRRAAADASVGDLAHAVRTNLSSGRGLPYKKLLAFQFRLLTTSGKLRQAAFFLRPNSADRAGLRLPDWMYPLYYLTRPFRLAWNWASAVDADDAPGERRKAPPPA